VGQAASSSSQALLACASCRYSGATTSAQPGPGLLQFAIERLSTSDDSCATVTLSRASHDSLVPAIKPEPVKLNVPEPKRVACTGFILCIVGANGCPVPEHCRSLRMEKFNAQCVGTVSHALARAASTALVRLRFWKRRRPADATRAARSRVASLVQQLSRFENKIRRQSDGGTCTCPNLATAAGMHFRATFACPT
jgi:hypothetical protein